MGKRRNFCIRCSGRVPAREVYYLYHEIEKKREYGYSSPAILYFMAQKVSGRYHLSLTYENNRDIFCFT